jgi:site-specific DNA recombinase
MRVAIYGRVSTGHQVEQQTIEQQIERLTAHVAAHAAEGWTLDPPHVFRDDGHSGAGLARPGLDRLRDAVKGREVDRVLVTAPDRLARNYVHQMVLPEEWARAGCATEFLDRPMSDDPHDQLLLQIRGAVAEYERTRPRRCLGPPNACAAAGSPSCAPARCCPGRTRPTAIG